MKDREIFADVSPVGEVPDRFALIIGAMKGGTTSLYEILSQHNEICSSKVKEPDYFTEDRSDDSYGGYLSLWDWKQGVHSIGLESSVAYTKAPYISGVPERIHKAALGQFRFIYMLRNPLRRIESQVRHGVFAGWGKSLDHSIPEDAINFSRYAMQLEGFLEYFSLNDIMLVTLEEFKQDPHAVLFRMCQFLEVDERFEFKDVEGVRNSGDFFNSTENIARITQSGFGQFISGKLLSPKTKAWLRGCIARLSKGKEEVSNIGRWQLTTNEQNFILSELAEDMKRLESDFGVDTKKYWNIEAGKLKDN